MKSYLLIPLFFILINCTTESGESLSENALAEKANTLWISDSGFVHPESIIYYPDSNFLFISNIGNNESNETPDGFISKVDMEGNIIKLKWIDSIQSPKGQCIANGKYYVSALDELLEVDLQTGEILFRHSSPEVVFLNDVTADQWGNIYVSGMRENAIYKLDTSHHFERWFQNDSLHHPNGLLAVDKKIYVGGWGNMDKNEPNIDSVGHFMVIDLETKAFGYSTDIKPGKLDGIQHADHTSESFIVSSWQAGEILKIDVDGNVEELFSTSNSVGDILYMHENGLLIIPLNFQHRLEAFKLE